MRAGIKCQDGGVKRFDQQAAGYYSEYWEAPLVIEFPEAFNRNKDTPMAFCKAFFPFAQKQSWLVKIREKVSPAHIKKVCGDNLWLEEISWLFIVSPGSICIADPASTWEWGKILPLEMFITSSLLLLYAEYMRSQVKKGTPYSCAVICLTNPCPQKREEAAAIQKHDSTQIASKCPWISVRKFRPKGLNGELTACFVLNCWTL